MDTARDHARRDPWRESAERSRARRDTRKRAVSARSRVPVVGPRIVAALALLAAIAAGTLAGNGPQDSTPPARADVSAALSSSRAGPQSTAPTAAASPGWASCPLAVAPQGYANPLAGAVVKPERIDQGVDYAGSGTLAAIGAGRVTYLATSESGWPGAFIEYQLSDGPDAGRYVYYAEAVSPAAGLHVGETLSAGQPVAHASGGIEIGWGSGVGTQPLAQALGQWSSGSDSSNVASPAGKDFSALIAQLGGPPGKVEG